MSTTDINNLKKVYLIKVAADKNNNKYYNMFELGDGTWNAEYARVGEDPVVKNYPMRNIRKN